MPYYTLPIQKAWTYSIITPSDELAVSLDEVKTYLKVTVSAQDIELTNIIKSAMYYGEKATRRDFITRTYRTYRDFFSDFDGAGSVGIELRKSILQSVESIEYLVDNVWTLVDTSVYYNTIENDYSSVFLNDGEAWPTDIDSRNQAVRIDFKSGYGDSESDIPFDIKQAIKSHVVNYFVNRGDCSLSNSVPAISKDIYNKYCIVEMGLS